MGNKHIGKIILFYILMFLSSFGGTIEQLLQNDYDYNYAMGYGLLITLLNILIVSLVMMIVPFICKISKKELLPFKIGKRVCLWNSIILFIVSCILMSFINIGFIGGIGAVFFYFINKWIFVEPRSLSKEENKKELIPFESEHAVIENTHQPVDFDIDKMSPQEAAEYLVAEQLGEKYIPKEKQDKKIKIKYCSQCGSQIDPVTGFKFTKFFVAIIALTLVIATLSTLCVLQYINIQKLKDKISTSETLTTSSNVATMKVAIEADFVPYSWIESGNYYGLHVDIAKEIAKRTGKNVSFVVVDFDDMISGVDSGLYDMAFGLEKTSEREKIVAFTDEYYDGMCAIYHTKGEKPSFSEWTEYVKILVDIKEDGTLRNLLSKYNLS